jgi:hypothetical protein
LIQINRGKKATTAKAAAELLILINSGAPPLEYKRFMWPERNSVKASDMTEAERLRKRACWYRDFAKLSTSGERISRLALADFFERKAQEAEIRAGKAQISHSPPP